MADSKFKVGDCVRLKYHPSFPDMWVTRVYDYDGNVVEVECVYCTTWAGIRFQDFTLDALVPVPSDRFGVG